MGEFLGDGRASHLPRGVSRGDGAARGRLPAPGARGDRVRARRLRAGQGGLRARLRAQPPPGLGPDPAGRAPQGSRADAHPRVVPPAHRRPVPIRGLRRAARVRRRPGRGRAQADGADRAGPPGLGLLPHARVLPPAQVPGRHLPQRLRHLGRRAPARSGARGAAGHGRPRRVRQPRGAARPAGLDHRRALAAAPDRAADRLRGAVRFRALAPRRDPYRDRGAHAGGTPPGAPGGGRERHLLPPGGGADAPGPRPERLRRMARSWARPHPPGRPCPGRQPVREQSGAHAGAHHRALGRSPGRGRRPVIPAQLEAYRDVAPRGTIDLLLRLAERVRGRRFLHVSPSRFGAGPAEILHRAIPILRDLGVEAEWEVIVGNPDFYAAVARLERSLTGLDGTMTEAALHAWGQAAGRKAAALGLDGEVVMVHDLAPLPLVRHRPRAGKWVWRCHGDLSRAYRRAWYLVRGDLERYDAAVFSLPKFAAALPIPTLIVHPSIDPLSEKNRELPRSEIGQILDRLGVPRDKPILLQVAPYARSKDPAGVVRAYRLARKYVECRLVLAGWGATDNPEGQGG